ncbi:MAG: hypothetical protein VX392_05500 [Verrucomicrobiota bacterium]|nr:hypothetical protein [Verrucomicrobiota bacterium]
MSREAYLGLFGVVLLIAIAVLGGFQSPGGGGGYSDSSHHDHGDRYVDPKTGEMTSDDDYDDHDGD